MIAVQMHRNWTWTLGVAAGLAILATGCGGLGKSRTAQPPDYLVVTGVGGAGATPEAAGPPVDALAKAFPEKLEARNSAAVNTAVSDPAERLLMARAAARRAALRAIAQTILATDVPGFGPPAKLMQADPERKAALEKLLESQSDVDYSEQDGACEATVSITGPRVAQALGRSTDQTPQPAAATENPWDTRKMRQEAYDAAVKNAKEKLRNQVLALTLPNHKTVGEALEKNPGAQTDMNALIFLAEPDEVQHKPNGACEVKIFFDANRARALVTRNGKGWLWWLGL